MICDLQRRVTEEVSAWITISKERLHAGTRTTALAELATKILREGQGTRQVAPTCRRYGISRKTFYKWKKRYDQQDWAGLRDRSHAPHRPRAATPPEIVAKILYLRQHYHLGPARISMYLCAITRLSFPLRLSTRYCAATESIVCHKTKAISPQATLAPLRKATAGPPPSDRHKFLAAIPGKRKSYWQFTAIDDCTRLRILKIYERNNQKNAIDFVNYVLSRCLFVCKRSKR
jgi:transposase